MVRPKGQDPGEKGVKVQRDEPDVRQQFSPWGIFSSQKAEKLRRAFYVQFSTV